MQRFNPRLATYREVRDHVQKVVAEVSGLAVDDLDSGMSIAEDIAPNSIDRITLFMALEDEFGESIPESEVQGITTLGELLDFVQTRVKALRAESD